MINISDYADPNFEALRIGDAAGGDMEKLDQIKSDLVAKHDRGLCRIWHLDDELAIVAWTDEFLITIRDHSLATAVTAVGEE